MNNGPDEVELPDDVWFGEWRNVVGRLLSGLSNRPETAHGMG
jgi:hypothetical protein